jgi:hypothetical protein
MMENGRYLELEVTPTNPSWDYSWEQMLTDRLDHLFWCGSSSFPERNAIYREIPADWVAEMHVRLGSKQADRLLRGDIWSEIEPHWLRDSSENRHAVDRWLSERGNNGGITLRKLIGPA